MAIKPTLTKSSAMVVLVVFGCMISTIMYQRKLIHTMANAVTMSQVASEADPDDERATRKLTPPLVGASEKPLFILHIGPPKTGTTTLQCELGSKYQSMTQENFYYLGTWYPPLCGLPSNYTNDGFSDATRPVLLHCYAAHAKSGCNLEHQWQEFAETLYLHKQHNVIMSDEMFHHHFQLEDVKRLAKLLQPHWNVRILFTYRHFYQAVPSMYHQLNDPYAIQPGMANAYEKTVWPADGGYKIPSFQQGNRFQIDRQMERFQYWVDYFPEAVQVFNMNGDKNYLQQFLCTMIPEVQSLCTPSNKANAKSATEESRKDNDSSSKYLRYDMLAVEAQEEGLLNHTEIERSNVRDAIQKHCEEKGLTGMEDFPLECLDEQVKDIFLQQSLKAARLMQPYFVNHVPLDIQSEIIAGFQKYDEHHKFCSVDAKQTLRMEDWRLFFETM